MEDIYSRIKINKMIKSLEKQHLSELKLIISSFSKLYISNLYNKIKYKRAIAPEDITMLVNIANWDVVSFYRFYEIGKNQTIKNKAILENKLKILENDPSKHIDYLKAIHPSVIQDFKKQCLADLYIKFSEKPNTLDDFEISTIERICEWASKKYIRMKEKSKDLSLIKVYNDKIDLCSNIANFLFKKINNHKHI